MGYFKKIYASDLPSRAKTVYMYLKDRSNAYGECWPAINTIARETSLSRSTVKRALADLDKCGFIRVKRMHRENGGCTSNRYFLAE